MLDQLVCMHMKTVIFYVTRYEKHFREVMEQKLRLSSEEAIRGHRKRLTQAEKRLTELDRLFIRIYEDNVAGRITDERFSMMSRILKYRNDRLRIWDSSSSGHTNTRICRSLRPTLCGNLSRRSTLKPRARAAASGGRTSVFPMTLWVLTLWKN